MSLNLKITKDQLDPKKKPRKIGNKGGKPIFELFTKGGLAIVIEKSDSGTKILGAAPHRAIARHMAMKSDPDILIEEFSKSDEQMIIQAGEQILPYFESLVEELNKKIG